jgi:hypothetical protein
MPMSKTRVDAASVYQVADCENLRDVLRGKGFQVVRFGADTSAAITRRLQVFDVEPALPTPEGDL